MTVICLLDTSIQSNFERLGPVGLRSNAKHWFGNEMQVVSNLQLYLDRIHYQIHTQASPEGLSLNLQAKGMSCSASPVSCRKSWLLALFSFPQQTVICRRPPYRHFCQFRPGLRHLQRQQDPQVRSSSDMSPILISSWVCPVRNILLIWEQIFRDAWFWSSKIGPFHSSILNWLITKVWETSHIIEGEIKTKCYLCPDCEKSLISAKIKNAQREARRTRYTCPRAAREFRQLSIRDFSQCNGCGKSRVGVILRALAFHRCGLGSIPTSTLYVHWIWKPRYVFFFQSTTAFPSPKPNIWFDLLWCNLIACLANYSDQ